MTGQAGSSETFRHSRGALLPTILARAIGIREGWRPGSGRGKERFPRYSESAITRTKPSPIRFVHSGESGFRTMSSARVVCQKCEYDFTQSAF